MVCKVRFNYKNQITSEQKVALGRLLGKEVETAEDAESGLLVMTNTWEVYHADPTDLVDAGVFGFEISEVMNTPIVRVMNKVLASMRRFDEAVARMAAQQPPVKAQYNRGGVLRTGDDEAIHNGPHLHPVGHSRGG